MRIIGGRFKGHRLTVPATIRPTSAQLREAVFNIAQSYLEGATVLDLFCGSGAIGLEALSRGAQSATFVDLHTQAVKENLARLNLTATVLRLDALSALKKLDASFDLIYVDPPYEATPKKPAPATCYAAQILAFIDTSSLLKPGGLLFIEEGGAFERVAPLTRLKEGRERLFGTSRLSVFE